MAWGQVARATDSSPSPQSASPDQIRKILYGFHQLVRKSAPLPLPLLSGIFSLQRSGRPPLPGLSKVFEDLALATHLGLTGQPTTMGTVSALMALALSFNFYFIARGVIAFLISYIGFLSL